MHLSIVCPTPLPPDRVRHCHFSLVHEADFDSHHSHFSDWQSIENDQHHSQKTDAQKVEKWRTYWPISENGEKQFENEQSRTAKKENPSPLAHCVKNWHQGAIDQYFRGFSSFKKKFGGSKVTVILIKFIPI